MDESYGDLETDVVFSDLNVEQLETQASRDALSQDVHRALIAAEKEG